MRSGATPHFCLSADKFEQLAPHLRIFCKFHDHSALSPGVLRKNCEYLILQLSALYDLLEDVVSQVMTCVGGLFNCSKNDATRCGIVQRNNRAFVLRRSSLWKLHFFHLSQSGAHPSTSRDQGYYSWICRTP